MAKRFGRLLWRACWRTDDNGGITEGKTAWMSEDEARAVAAQWHADWHTTVYVEGAVVEVVE